MHIDVEQPTRDKKIDRAYIRALIINLLSLPLASLMMAKIYPAMGFLWIVILAADRLRLQDETKWKYDKRIALYRNRPD